MAELLKGAPVARALTEELAARCAALRERGIVPTLAIVRVGEREDDLSYERGALKRCEKVGIEARRVLLPSDVSQDELLAAIEGINADLAVHGCLMFRPLPAGLDEDAVAAALDPAKDVDSMTPASLLTTLSGRGEGFAPCTAEAVLSLLDHYGLELDGAKVAVVGRSLVIGRPVAAMLTARNATVTTCHTHTRDLAAECRSADIVVAAVGRARTIGADAVREGQTIVDVGINWDEAAGKYMMSQYSHATGSIAPSVDRNNNQQLAFDNVLVIMTEFDVWPDPGDSGYDLQKVTYGSGYGYYFSGGRAEKVCWEKPTPDSALRILYAFGEEEQVQFNTGKTYLAVVDLEEAEGFTFEPDESEVASSASVADAGSAAAESTAAQ